MLSKKRIKKSIHSFYSTKTSASCFTQPYSSEKTHLQTKNVTRISFMTDAEGDAAYFDRFIEQSKVLDFVPQSENKSIYGDRIIRFKDDIVDETNTTKRERRENINNSIFVFGGDTCDKGGSDLYVLRQLLSLRERYPNRVFFIMGNRDINKLRISHEMTMGPHIKTVNASGHNDIFENSPLASSLQSLPDHDGCWWLRGSDKVGDPDSKLIEHRVPTHAPDRLKWMLGETMGSPDAFEFRKQELKKHHENQEPLLREDNKISKVTDDDVVNSYIETCQPDGLMGQYLFHARLAIQIGKVLFMHGSLPLTQEILKNEKETFDQCFNQSKSQKKMQDTFWYSQLHLLLPWNPIALSQKCTFPFTNDKINCKSEINPIDFWLKELETFRKNEIQSWSDSIMNSREVSLMSSSTCIETNVDNSAKFPKWATRGGYENAKNGEALMQYGMGKTTPDLKSNPTVVYSSWSVNGIPKISLSSISNSDLKSSSSSPSFTYNMSKTYLRLLCDFFTVSNLDAIITGHQPHGDLPLPMQINCSSHLKTIQHINNDSTNLHDRENSKQDNNKIGKTQHPKKKRCWIMSCDTSFSGDTNWIHPHRKNLGRETSLSGRGNTAVRCVIIIFTVFNKILFSRKTKYTSNFLCHVFYLIATHLIKNVNNNELSYNSWNLFSEVIIEQNSVTGEVTNLFSHGKLSDGTYYESLNLLQTDNNNKNQKSESSHCWVGKVVHKDAITFETNEMNKRKDKNVWDTMNEIIETNNLVEWCVKSKLSDGRYLVTSAKGYDVWNAIATSIKN